MFETQNNFFEKTSLGLKAPDSDHNHDEDIEGWKFKDNLDLKMRIINNEEERKQLGIKKQRSGEDKSVKKTLLIRLNKRTKDKKKMIKEIKSLNLGKEAEKSSIDYPIFKEQFDCDHVRLQMMTERLPPIVRDRYADIFKNSKPLTYQSLEIAQQQAAKLKRKKKLNKIERSFQKKHKSRISPDYSDYSDYSDVHKQLKELKEARKFWYLENFLKKNSSELPQRYNIYEKCLKRNNDHSQEKKIRQVFRLL